MSETPTNTDATKDTAETPATKSLLVDSASSIIQLSKGFYAINSLLSIGTQSETLAIFDRDIVGNPNFKQDAVMAFRSVLQRYLSIALQPEEEHTQGTKARELHQIYQREIFPVINATQEAIKEALSDAQDISAFAEDISAFTADVLEESNR